MNNVVNVFCSLFLVDWWSRDTLYQSGYSHGQLLLHCSDKNLPELVCASVAVEVELSLGVCWEMVL